MTRIIHRVVEALASLRAAVAAASALENGHRPLPGDLRQLGIDVAAFVAIARA